ncbi:MAG TPA: HTH domain-containing protein [Pseudomonadota bacterium]|nr:HTH domain-containing protein [Pseudomonadota bacterium]
MTFLEAAFEVLRREGRPLHFKDLTRLALKYDLLSVVGRDPEEMMQSRLQAEARRPSTDLVRISPGVFGLRNMAPRSGKGRAGTEAAVTEAPVDESTAAKASESKSPAPATAESASSQGRRRRGGASKAGNPASPPASEESTAAAAASGAAPPKDPVKEPAAPAARDSRRGSRRGREERGAASAPQAATASASPAKTDAPASPEPAAAGPSVSQTIASAPPETRPTAAAEQMAEPAPARESQPSAPLPPAPPAAVETQAKAADSESRLSPPTDTPAPVAVVVPAVPAPVESPATPAAPVAAPAPVVAAPSTQSPKPAPSSSTPAPAAEAKPAPAGGPGQPAPRSDGGGPRLMALADAAYDVLRGSSDTRPLSNRQIAEIALKRRLVRGELADISRALRGALVREQRQRDSEGLRPRLRNLGQGQYALGERKLEPELYTAERDLLDRLSRTREATRVALRRRLRSMPAGPFELLMRLLLERLGIVSPELLKRGEGVAYFGGSISRGSRQLRLLCAIRPGEAEIPREAIGELRAGVRMRGFDEGLLLASARLSSAALAEVNALPGIDVYDHDALTELLVKNQIGVRRMLLPIEYLDTELFTELTEAN